MNKTIQFESDKVKIRTGKPDNSADVVFEVGEYTLEKIQELVTVTDSILYVTVEIVKDS